MDIRKNHEFPFSLHVYIYVYVCTVAYNIESIRYEIYCLSLKLSFNLSQSTEGCTVVLVHNAYSIYIYIYVCNIQVYIHIYMDVFVWIIYFFFSTN